jgi:hypothetical protein
LHRFVAVHDWWLQKCELQPRTYKVFIRSFSVNIFNDLSRAQGTDTSYALFSNNFTTMDVAEILYTIKRIVPDYYLSVRHVMYLTLLITQICKQVSVWGQWWASVFPICSEAWYCFNSVLKWEIVLNEYKILHQTLYYSKSVKSFLNLFQNSLIALILFAPYHSGHLKADIDSNK